MESCPFIIFFFCTLWESLLRTSCGLAKQTTLSFVHQPPILILFIKHIFCWLKVPVTIPDKWRLIYGLKLNRKTLIKRHGNQPACIPLYKSSTGQRTFHYRMVHIWNNLDSILKTAKSISTFKFYLKNKLITDFLNSTL